MFNYFFIKHLLSFCDLLGAGGEDESNPGSWAQAEGAQVYLQTLETSSSPCGRRRQHTNSRIAVWLLGVSDSTCHSLELHKACKSAH